MTVEVASLGQRLRDRQAVIGIVGMGYVGLPLALRFAAEGFKVIGFDIDQRKISKITEGHSYINHIADTAVASAAKAGFTATSDFSASAGADVLIICVPTPLNKHREPDLTFVVSSMGQLVPHLRKGQLISLESTTYPGTTDEVIKPMIESRGFVIGEDVYLVFSPEREDPGNASFSTQTIPKIVGGCTPACLEMGVAVYDKVIDKVVPVSSARAAEMAKLLENTHRLINIGLVNEMKIIADKMGIDIHEVVDAAATKPFGFTGYQPGPGVGGHCIPVDPYYLSWKAREFGVRSRFIELAGEINEAMPEYVVEKVMLGLNQHRKSISGARILVAGLAYKKNIDDYRESPSVHILNHLRRLGAEVHYADPFIPRVKPDNHDITVAMEAVPLNVDTLAGFDCVVIATNHDDFDYELIRTGSSLVVDARGVYRSQHDNVFHA